MRVRRRIIVPLATVVVVAVLGLAAGGWYYSGQLLPAVEAAAFTPDVEVVEVDGSVLTLEAVDDADDDVVQDLTGDHVMGLEHPGGYVQLSGTPASGDGGTTQRSFEVLTGTVPAAGDPGDLHADALPDDPAALRLPFSRVTVPSQLGDLTGWRFPAEGPSADRWVVLVHGRGATRGETLRAVDAIVQEAGWSALVVSYRNGPGAPPSPDGYGHFGDAEWQDLEAWLRWLVADEAPTALVLQGFSQGASVVATCLRRCDHRDRVDGVVLDSPLLSMQATLELQAAERGIPGPLIGPLLVATRLVSEARGGPDLGALEHVQPLAAADLPVLAFHGMSDRTVPFEPTEELAFADPQQVVLELYEGGHVRAWNHDPEAYAAALRAFLEAR